MKKKKTKNEYYGGRIKTLTETVVGAIKQYPDLLNDTPKLHALLKENLEGYGHVESCFNCRRSMKITGYVADLLDALLILAMARQVRDNMRAGIPFTIANRVHIPTLNVSNAIIKRQTKCDYLGLIKQPPELERTGYWVLTSWAWKALKGEPIPECANYWEGHLISRSERTTTLSKMFNMHRDLVQKAINRRKKVRSDYRADFEEYNLAEWSEFGGIINEEA